MNSLFLSMLGRAERKVELLRQSVNRAERVLASETEHRQLLQQRNANCRALRAAGASIKDLQEVLGVSLSRFSRS